MIQYCNENDDVKSDWELGKIFSDETFNYESH